MKPSSAPAKRKIFNFLAITFGISWVVAAILYLLRIESGSIPFVLLVALFYMTAPGVATLMVSRRNLKESLQVYGLSWKGSKLKNVFFAIAFYLSFIALTFLLIFLIGNICEYGGFGRISLDEKEIMANVAKSTPSAAIPDAQFPPMVVFVIAGLLGSVIAGCTFNLPFALGEELGWRGFLLKETAALGFWKANLLIGVIWGIWHWPVIWMGHNYPGHPYWGSLLMILFCISLSLMHSIVRLKTGSVIFPAALHGMINAGAPISLLVIVGNNVLLGSVAGVAGILAAFILSFFYLLLDKEPIQNSKACNQLSIHQSFVMSSKLFLLIIASFLYSVTKAQPISVRITEEPIQFSRGEATYSGTFSKPKQNGKFPVIVLVSGMGLQDRDWTFIKGKYQLAKVLTEQLTEQGFAVLRYDDRGYGQSTGTKETLTGFDDLAEDVYAAVAALRQRKDVGSIGLMGHSLGGILSVMTASRQKDIDFVITLAGSYQTGGEIMMEQARTLKRWKTSGTMTDGEVVANGQKFVRNWVDYSKGESRGLDTMKSILHNLISYQVRSMSAEDWEKNKKVYKDSSEMIAKVYEEVVGYYTSPHQLSFASYDAVKDLKNISCPVLVLFGEKDQHVTVKSNLPKVADAIAEAGLAKVTIHIVPGTDHSFSAAGGMQAGKIVPGLVEQITCWLRAAIKN